MVVSQRQYDILLATYNGATFVEAQLRSLLAQSQDGFRILARDDSSSDGTLTILEAVAEANQSRFRIIKDGKGRLGACGNFGALLALADAPYVMFCDQDDIWVSDKIDRILGKMQEEEAVAGLRTPVLVHSDLKVVDEDTKEIAPSFWKYQNLEPEKGKAFNRLLVQNVVTGCATMVNRALVQKALPIPGEAIMHDWWLALVAAAFGRIGHLPEATVLYRQHGRNELGAKQWNAGYVIRKAMRLFDREELSKSLGATQRQAAAFAQRFGDDLAPGQRAAAEAYASLAKRGFLERRIMLWRYGLFKNGLIRNLGLFARI